MTSSTLIVIEAPGKVAKVSLCAIGHGLKVEVFATKGHLRRHAGLYPLGMTATTEPGRTWTPRAAQLKSLAQGREVVIATDPDAEGEVIARDVHVCVGTVAASVTRLRLGALSHQAFGQAWSARQAWRSGDEAAEGDARRRFDRAIAHAFSQDGLPVGRVLSSALGAAVSKDGDLAIGYVQLTLPAADGGRPWVARLPVNAGNRELWERRLDEWDQVAARVSVRATGHTPLARRPLDFAQLVLAEAGYIR